MSSSAQKIRYYDSSSRLPLGPTGSTTADRGSSEEEVEEEKEGFYFNSLKTAVLMHWMLMSMNESSTVALSGLNVRGMSLIREATVASLAGLSPEQVRHGIPKALTV